MSKATDIARVNVTMDDVEPAVMRRLEVPLGLRLDRLNLVLQTAIGWTNSHLWEFRIGEAGWGLPDPDWPEGPDDASKITLHDVIKKTGSKNLVYIYDFGDDWQHSVTIESIAAPEPDVLYPRLLAAEGACPPEDVGGPWGYAEWLEAVDDPDHERYEDFEEWQPINHDVRDADPKRINRALATLAKRWQPRKPRKK